METAGGHMTDAMMIAEGTDGLTTTLIGVAQIIQGTGIRSIVTEKGQTSHGNLKIGEDLTTVAMAVAMTERDLTTTGLITIGTKRRSPDKQRKGSHLKEEGVRKSEHWEGVEETDGDVLVESTGIKMADKSTKQNGEVGVQQRTPEKRAQPPPSPNRYLSEEGYSQRPPDHASSRYNEPGYDRWANLDYDRRSSGPVGSDGRYDKGGRYSSYDRRGTYPSYGIPSYQRSYSDSWGSSYGRGHIDWETPLPRNERLERYICIHIHI